MGLLPDSARPAHARELSLHVAWPSPHREFFTSLRAFFTGPRAPNTSAEFSGSPYLTIYWVRGALPGRAFLASSLWHVAAMLVALLPIWGFLASPARTLPPVRIELTYYGPPHDLPVLALPGPPAKPAPPNPAPEAPRIQRVRGADAFHPRQTILSTPSRVTHPRQTLIQPKAPPSPPKIVPPLPNIVEWAGATAPPKPQLRISPSASAPRLEQRTMRDVVAPEIAANHEKNIGVLNIAAAAAIAQPQMPIAPMSAPVAAHRSHEEASAPDVASGSPGNSTLHQVIALSAAPAPPAPEVSVPEGNLAARISISPEGTQPGTPAGAEHGGSSGGATNGTNGASGNGDGSVASVGSGSGSGGGGNASSLPAGISISGGSSSHPVASNGAGVPAGTRSGGLILKPMTTAPPRAEAGTYAARRTPPAVRTIDSNTPPEKILWDKKVYTLNVDMPNLTSVSGSWILKFAQLDDDQDPPYIRKPPISGPIPVHKVDPKYPPELIQAHVEGEVILYAIIRKDGTVDSIQLVHSLDPLLDANSMQALSGWRFRPATREGAPVELETVVHIPFRFRVPGQY